MHFTSRLIAPAFLLASIVTLAASLRADLVPEGRFESGLDARGQPKGWAIDPPSWKLSPHLSVVMLSEAKETPEGPTENHFIRLGNTALPDEEGLLVLAALTPLPTPAPARLKIGWRVRAVIEATSRIHTWSSVYFKLRFLDKQGNVLAENNALFRLVRSTQGRWIEREREVDVPAGTTDIELLPGLYLVRGSVDFDDITVSAIPNQ